MSFIQCKNRDEVEKEIDKKAFRFVSEDHRVYETIEFSDDACWRRIDGEILGVLLELQDTLEFMNQNVFECSFTKIADDAKELKESFLKAMEIIKFKKTKELKA